MTSEKKYTVIPGVLDTRPNALEELGISPDIARNLSVEALSRLVKNASRIYRADLHPDSHGGRTSQARQRKVAAIEAAMDRLEEEGAEAQLTSLLEARRKKAKRTSESTAGREVYKNPETDLNQTFADVLFEGLYDEQAVARFKSMRVVLSSNYDTFYTSEYGLNSNRRTIELIAGTDHDGIDIYELAREPLGEAFGAYFSHRTHEEPSNKDVLILDDERELRLSDESPFVMQNSASETHLDIGEGIYVCRGIMTDAKDNRSVERFTRTTKSQHIDHVRPIGCVSEEVWAELTRLADTQQGKQKIYQAIERGEGATAAGDRERFSGISFSQHHLGFYAEDLNRVLSKTDERGFSTSFKKGWVLIGHHDKVMHDGSRAERRPKQLVPLGTVEYAVLEK